MPTQLEIRFNAIQILNITLSGFSLLRQPNINQQTNKIEHVRRRIGINCIFQQLKCTIVVVLFLYLKKKQNSLQNKNVIFSKRTDTIAFNDQITDQISIVFLQILWINYTSMLNKVVE